MVKGIAPPDLNVKEKLVHCRKFIAQNDTNPTDPSSPLNIVTLTLSDSEANRVIK